MGKPITRQALSLQGVAVGYREVWARGTGKNGMLSGFCITIAVDIVIYVRDCDCDCEVG